MNLGNPLEFFQGLDTLFASDPVAMFTRLGLIVLGMVLVYLGKKGTLEPLLMIPMGMGMIAVNAGVMFLDPITVQHLERDVPTSALVQSADPSATIGGNAQSAPFTTDRSAEKPQVSLEDLPKSERPQGTLIIEPMVTKTDNVLYMLQLDFLQPVYTFTFPNGLIACLVFMGIGVLLDVGFVLARPMESMFLALCAELGTILVFPIAVGLGMSYGEAASVAMIGSADGPMVMFTTLKLAPDLFVPITVVSYLYLGLAYGGYPYMIKLLVPKALRATRTEKKAGPVITSGEKLTFAVVACAILCLLFPMAAPLFLSLFLGVAVRESEIKPYINLFENVFLYGATMFLGLMLGVLCGAKTLLDPVVLKLLVLGVLALVISGMGGIAGGYALYFLKKRRYNPIIGIAGVSCVPTTAKVAQKMVQKDAPGELILPEALGASISGVITSAIICGVYVTLVPMLK